ncbi:MAG: hypothetical protein H7A25_15630 [Leptospiraceae bacterium]|nr:hypothetical protein [Leptospiraceae bacterium]MCP5501331.1 hypothetical protein [Leptospiraceae bacterium]
MYQVLFFLSLSFFFNSCLYRNNLHSNYWKDYFSSQESLQNKDEKAYHRLFGSLSQTEESNLFQSKTTTAYSGNVKIRDNTYLPSFQNFYFKDKESQYSLHVRFSPRTLDTKEIYEIKRSANLQFSPYAVYDFIQWWKLLHENSLRENFSLKLQKSSTYKFLCNNFSCSIKPGSLSFLLSDSLQKNYPIFFSDLNKRLSMIDFEVPIFFNGQYHSRLFSTSNGIHYTFIDTQFKNPGLYENLKRISFKIRFTLRFLGMKIKVNNLRYTIFLHLQKDKEIISGHYTNYPEYSIEGRLFYLLPEKLVDIFIPGDMNSYLKDYFDLVCPVSPFGGNRFETKLIHNQTKTNLSFASYTYNLRQKFNPFRREKKEKDTHDFFGDWKKKLVEELEE